MISDALACPGVVLISREHELIPSIANIILGNSTVVPQTWPDTRFDVVWIFDLKPATSTYTFNQLPQLLLQGDLPTPLLDRSPNQPPKKTRNRLCLELY
jgi:hypothetical protein